MEKWELAKELSAYTWRERRRILKAARYLNNFVALTESKEESLDEEIAKLENEE